MADHTGIERRDGSTRLKKSVSKFAFRGKERMMRTLGMGEETKDEIIDNYVHLVNKQQVQFQKFQRDVKVYIQSLNAMKLAADNFYKSLNDIYDDGWVGKDMLSSLAQTSGLLFDNLCTRINIEVSNALEEHLNQCQEVKQKVQKRGRKLVDFDGAKRSYYTLKSAKKMEDAKLSKAQEQMDNSKGTYDTLNTQLHQELPDLYDSRVVLSTDVIGTIASAEKELFTELAEIREKLLHVSRTVKDAYGRGDYRIQRLHSAVNQHSISQQPTLPADEVVNLRLRSDSDSFTEDDHTYHQPPREKRPNDYVNVQIGGDGSVAVNGHSESPPNIYDSVENDNQSSKSEEDVSVEQPATAPDTNIEKPEPAPRVIHQPTPDYDQSSDSDSEAAPVAAPVTVTPSSAAAASAPLEKTDSTVEKAPVTAAAPPVVMRRTQNEANEENNDPEAANKRSSFLGLGRFMSGWSRSKPAATQDDTAVKAKKGFFTMKRFRKDKNIYDDVPVSSSSKSATLPPPKLTTTLPFKPEMRRSSASSYESMGDGPHASTAQSSGLFKQMQSAPSQEITDVRAAGSEAASVQYANAPTSQEQLNDYHDSNVSEQEGQEKIDGPPLPQRNESVMSADQPVGDEARTAEMASGNAYFAPDQTEDTGVYEDMEVVGETPQAERESREGTVSDGEYEDTVVGAPPAQNRQQTEMDTDEDYDDVEVGPLSTQDVQKSISIDESRKSVDDYDDVIVYEDDSDDTIVPTSAKTDDEVLPDNHTDEEHEDVVIEQELRSKAPIPAYSCVEKTSKEEKPKDKSSEEPIVLEELHSNAAEVQPTNLQKSGALATFKMKEIEQSKTDSENESDVSSYHSSQISSARSSVSLSDAEISKISETLYEKVLPQTIQPKSEALPTDKAANPNDVYEFANEAKSSPQHPASSYPEELVGYEFPTAVRPNPSQVADSPALDSDDVYMIMEDSNQGAKTAPPASKELEDDYEDTVYDTIEITSPTAAQSEDVYDLPDHDAMPGSQNKATSEAAQEILPPHFLYKAIAMYPYQNSDEDELNFSKGDIIYVVEFPDPDEQDEGWQMGIVKSTWEDTQSTAGMGVFPENFTRRL